MEHEIYTAVSQCTVLRGKHICLHASMFSASPLTQQNRGHRTGVNISFVHRQLDVPQDRDAEAAVPTTLGQAAGGFYIKCQYLSSRHGYGKLNDVPFKLKSKTCYVAVFLSDD